MTETLRSEAGDAQQRLERVYEREAPYLLARLRAAGRTLEEAEDLVHDIFAETLERLPVVDTIRNLPAWMNTLMRRRMIDAWRHEQVQLAAGEIEVVEDALYEIVADAGLDPQDAYIRECLVDALNDALRELPPAQRQVIEAQVFGGLTFRELAEATGESIDTLTARKRYALRNLGRALRQWVET